MTSLGEAGGWVLGMILAGGFLLYLGANTTLKGASQMGQTFLGWGIVLSVVLVLGIVVVLFGKV